MRFNLKKRMTRAFPTTPPYPSTPAGRRRRSVPNPIRRIYLPLSVLEVTTRVMQRYGTEERECYVWWGGYFTAEGDAQIVTALCPDGLTEFGRIHFGNKVLTALHERLRALDQVLIAELHTHPSGAGGQNDVDAAHPAATYPGFISIVVPDFAFPKFYDPRDAYVYEYRRGGDWHELTREEIAERFVIEEPFILVST